MSTGVVIWLTGLPSAGKSTLAKALLAVLRASGTPACVLDGDDVRNALATTLGYSSAERAAFYETLARLAALLAAQGLVVLVPATAHRRAFRERARELAPAYLEVWVDTPLEECVKRDTKGLYNSRASGHASNVPGSDTPFEPPLEPAVVARGGMDAEAVTTVLEHVAELRSGASLA
jgi:adenylylsulfate kinase